MITSTFSLPQIELKCLYATDDPLDCFSDTSQGEVYLAGEIVAAGKYRQIDVGRIVTLTETGALPGSLDGRVACYERLPQTWGEMRSLTGDGKH